MEAEPQRKANQKPRQSVRVPKYDSSRPPTATEPVPPGSLAKESKAIIPLADNSLQVPNAAENNKTVNSDWEAKSSRAIAPISTTLHPRDTTPSEQLRPHLLSPSHPEETEVDASASPSVISTPPPAPLTRTSAGVDPSSEVATPTAPVQSESEAEQAGNSTHAPKLDQSATGLKAFPELNHVQLQAEIESTFDKTERERVIQTVLPPPPSPPKGTQSGPTAPKRGAWLILEPDRAWCPPELEPCLPFKAADAASRPHHYSESHAALPGWRLVAATRRGRMHEHKGTHREDAFALDTGSWFSTVCVCDGAGNYKFSRIGSETTAREMTREIHTQLAPLESKLGKLDQQTTNKLVEERIQVAVYNTREFLCMMAHEAGIKPSDLRCTLLVAVHYRVPSGSGFVIAQVGDGFIATRRVDGTSQRHGESDSGEFSGQVNCFMPDEPTLQKSTDSIKRIPEDEVEAILLCSDGVEDPFFPVPKNIGTLFVQLYQGVSAPLPDFTKQNIHGSILRESNSIACQRIQEWLAFEKRGENDDRTIAILHRFPPSPPAPPPRPAAHAVSEEASPVETTTKTPSSDSHPPHPLG